MAFELPRGFSLVGSTPQVDPAAVDFVSKVGTLDQSPAAPFTVPKGFKLITSPLVNQTVVPKGGVPQQITQERGDELALYDKMHQVLQAREREGQRGFWENAGLSLQKRLGNVIPGTVNMLNEAPPARIGREIARRLTGQEIDPHLSVDEGGAMLRAGAGAVGLDRPMSLQQARENLAVNEGAREYTRPQSTMLGGVAGDILTIATGRMPLGRTVVGMTKSPEKLEAIRRALDNAAPGVKRLSKRIWASEPMAGLRRAFGKAGEVGLEGATLAYLHDGDPTKTAVYGAGAQLAGSFALGAIKHPYYSMGTIAATALGWQMMKDAIPGGRDLVLKSVEHATKVATAGTILGGFAGLLGAGRYRGSSGALPSGKGALAKVFGHKYAEDVPAYAEGVNAALRTGPNSLWEQFTDDEKSKNPVLPTVMDKLSTDISAFTKQEITRMATAIRKGNLRQEVQRMLQNEDFAARMGY